MKRHLKDFTVKVSSTPGEELLLHVDDDTDPYQVTQSIIYENLTYRLAHRQRTSFPEYVATIDDLELTLDLAWMRIKGQLIGVVGAFLVIHVPTMKYIDCVELLREEYLDEEGLRVILGGREGCRTLLITTMEDVGQEAGPAEHRAGKDEQALMRDFGSSEAFNHERLRLVAEAAAKRALLIIDPETEFQVFQEKLMKFMNYFQLYGKSRELLFFPEIPEWMNRPDYSNTDLMDVYDCLDGNLHKLVERMPVFEGQAKDEYLTKVQKAGISNDIAALLILSFHFGGANLQKKIWRSFYGFTE